jgi:hypothetical protein
VWSLYVEKIELDLTGLTLTNSDEKPNYRPYTKTNGQTSPRAAKYREGASKGKFARYITVPEDNNKSKSHNFLPNIVPQEAGIPLMVPSCPG